MGRGGSVGEIGVDVEVGTRMTGVHSSRELHRRGRSCYLEHHERGARYWKQAQGREQAQQLKEQKHYPDHPKWSTDRA